ncbi:MAG: hypothetical protein OQK76_07480 [Gammaproteobacteria bacterium]|nr:hypothetical protein [Gammaproteobacteria bacterium]MCW8910448.1 hypothetical protein [Gammaproteobacteria bacterium]MCW9004891.1 hypothetical protein [Gammaproteobacteria bacterium]
MRFKKTIPVFLFILAFLFTQSTLAKDSKTREYKTKYHTHQKNTHKHKDKQNGQPFQALIAMIEENKSLINTNHQANTDQSQILLGMIESNKSLIDSNQTLLSTQNKTLMDMVTSFLSLKTAVDSNQNQNVSQDQLLMNMIEESKALNTAQNQALVSMIESNTTLIDNNQNQNISQDQMLLNMIKESQTLIDANRSDIAILTTTTSELKLKATSLDNEIIIIQDKVTTNENELRNVMAQLAESNNQMSLITQDLLNLSANHTADITMVNSEIAWLKAQISGLDLELKSLAEGLSQKLVDLNTAISKNSIALDGLMNEILLLTAETTQITALISSLNTAIADLEQRSENHEQQLGTLTQQFTAVSAKVTEISNSGIVPVDLTGVHAEYDFDGRKVYFWKTPPCANLNDFVSFCQNRGLSWWRAKSQADAQKLVDYGYNLDSNHTWIQIYGVTSQKGTSGLLDGFNITVDAPACVSGSNDGFTGIRKMQCSMCNPEDHGNKSCCWDSSHQYDWFVCEGNI